MSEQQRRMPTEKKVREHWNDWIVARINDPDEGVCYACEMITECERAHILARADGGDDAVENIHMLCRTCHKASEMLSGDEYWEWLDNWTVMDRLFSNALRAGTPVFKELSKVFALKA